MAYPCVTCHHPDREVIDQALAGGRSVNSTAKRFGINARALYRHRDKHLSPALVEYAKADRDQRVEIIRASQRSALERVQNLAARVEAVLDESKGQAFLAAARELRGSIELLAKLSGELRPEATVQVLNVQADPQWVALRSAILQSLAPYPEARIAVAEAVQRVEAGQAPPPGRIAPLRRSEEV